MGFDLKPVRKWPLVNSGSRHTRERQTLATNRLEVSFSGVERQNIHSHMT